jgi:uncharacterized protein YfaS (alpha-2-macroglobulin family)
MFFAAIGLFLSGAGYGGRMPSGAGLHPADFAFDPTATPAPGALATYIGPADLDRFPPSGMFSLRFDDPMDPASSAAPLLSFPYVEGMYTWSQSDTVLTFQPNAPLAPDETYTFFLDPALFTATGSRMDPSLQWTLRIEDGPTAVSISPQAGSLKSRKPAAITVAFDRNMDPAATAKAFSIQPSVRNQLSWRDARTAEVTLLEPLQPGNRYDFIFAGSGSAAPAAGADGIPMADDFVWSYWLNPLEAAVTTKSENMVEVKFNYALDRTATGSPFAVTPALEGTWTWVDDKTVRFEADNPIPFGQRYDLAVTGPLVDASGAMSPENAHYSFSAIPPVKIEEIPAEYVPVDYSDFRVIFSVPVEHASAEAAFGISPEVGGGFAWTETSSAEIMEFRPNRLLDAGASYAVTLQPSVLSLEGRPVLVDPLRVEFKTDPYYEWSLSPSYGVGSDVQVVDAEGTRRVQFGIPNQATIRFDLYSYDTDAFVRLYTGKYGDNGLRFTTDILPVPEAGKSPAATWWYTDDPSNDDPVHETAIPAEVKPGLYVLNLTYGGRLYDQLFLVLSANVLTLKQSGDELFVWMTTVHGAGVAGAEIRLYSNRGDAVRQGMTDKNGVCRIAVPAGVIPMLVTARQKAGNGSDVTLSGLDGQYRTVTPYSYTMAYSRSQRRYLAYIYTERPIYRPGQTVYFKAVIRKDNDADYRLLPAGTPVAVNVRDGRNSLVQTLALKTDEYGSVEGSFVLSSEAVLGEYTIETVVEGESQTQAFQVEDYRKPDYAVTIRPLDPAQANRIVSGESVELEAVVEYYFGGPAANAKVTVEAYYLATYSDWSYAEDTWTNSFIWYPTGTIHKTWSAETDSEGKARIHLTIGDFESEEGRKSWSNSSVSATYALQVTVDDGSHQTVSATYILKAFSASEIIDINSGGYIRRPGQPFSVRATAEDLAGAPVEGRALTLSVLEWDHTQRGYRTSATYPLETNSLGRAEQELTLDTGYYKLELRGEDPRGRGMTDTTWICVFSSQDDWFNRTEREVEIVADQDAYLPGQKARFMIESTFSGPALLTFERGRVLASMPVTLTAPLTVVEADILPEYAPNVYVTVNAWQPSEFITYDEYDYEYYGSNRPDSHLRLAAVELQVNAGSKELQVAISTDRETYAPGETMTVTLDVKDAKGNPVAAEVSLAAVDESIFALQGEQSADIFSAFYGPRRRSVLTYDSMSPDRIIIPPGGRGGGGGGAAPVGLRSDFEDTAAWFPSLKTDSGGRVSVRVQLPDNLTSWRLTAKAVTKNSLVGESQKNITVRQELMIRPVLPRLLTTGDRAEIVTYIHNNGSTQRRVTVQFQAEGLRLLESASQTAVLAAGEAAALRWPVVVEGVATGKIVVRVESEDGLKDAVSLPVSIQPAATTGAFNESGEFKGNARLVVAVPQTVPGTGQMTLLLSRSMSGSILNGLEYLTGYPYGCIEQTMSRALPNAVVGRAGALLGLGDPGMAQRLDPLIRASIRRLLNFQHRDGGWGWWYDDASTDYQTAWVLFGLAQLKAAGYAVDEKAIDGGVAYLMQNLETMDIRTRAFALYSMALNGRGDRERTAALADAHLGELDPFSQAALALALHALGDGDRAGEVVAEIGKHALVGSAWAYWPQQTSDGEYMRKTMSSTVRTTALVLDALVTIDPKNDLIPGAVKFLVRRRRGLYGWGTTNETCFTILALTDYLVQQGQQAGESSYRIKWNDQTLSSGVLRAGQNSVKVILPMDRLAPGINILTISATGSAELYYDMSAQYDLPEIPSTPAGAVSVSRRYLDPKTSQPLEDIRAGQLVRVELTVDAPADASYVLVEDHLPGGLEALNENLNTSPTAAGNSEYGSSDESYRWMDLGYNYKEIRGGSVSFFITDLSKGKHVITYLARAASAGEFRILPAQAYAMYDLGFWGRSAGGTLVIRG